MGEMLKIILGLALAACAAAGAADPPVDLPDVPVDCDFAFEMVILQDASHSFGNDMGNLKAQLPMLEAIKIAHPESRFAYYSFVDKPIAPFGWPNDYCWKELSPFTEDTNAIATGVESLVTGGGYDYPEVLLSAMQHAALSPAIGWTPSMKTGSGRPIARVVLSITDAVYHVAGHGLPLGLYINNGDEVLDCENEDYPSISQVVNAFTDNNIFAGFLVANDPIVPTVDLVDVYSELATEFHGADGVAVADIKDDARDFAEGIRQILIKLNESLCPTEQPTQPPNTTLPPPVTIVEECPYTYEMAFQMDLSHSYTNELNIGMGSALGLFGTMQMYYPGSMGAAVSHSDKPIPKFGFSVSQDYCHWVHQGMTEDFLSVQNAFTGMSTRSGWDWNENQIESGMHTVLSGNTGWSNEEVRDVNGSPKIVKRALIVLTDSGYHKAGDGLSAGLVPNNGDDILQCVDEDYPSEDQFIAAMKKQDTAVFFLVPHDITPAHIDPVPIYGELSQKLVDAGVVSYVMDIGQNVLEYAVAISTLMGTADECFRPVDSRRLLESPAEKRPMRFLRGAEPPMQPMMVFGDL